MIRLKMHILRLLVRKYFQRSTMRDDEDFYTITPRLSLDIFTRRLTPLAPRRAMLARRKRPKETPLADDTAKIYATPHAQRAIV